MFNFFLSSLYLVFIGSTSLLFFAAALVIRCFTFPLDRKRFIVNLFSSFWASVYLWCMPFWRVRVYGREKLRFDNNFVIVGNHQSQLDILLAFNLFYPFRWVSKAEVFKIPFVGWNMILNGYVRLKRGDKESIKQMMKQCESILLQGCSLFFFPEGTRSRDGRLKNFKSGAFILAHKTGTDILPVVIKGTREALPKHTLKLTGKKEMSITVLDPLLYESFSDSTPQETADIVKKRIETYLEGGS